MLTAVRLCCTVCRLLSNLTYLGADCSATVLYRVQVAVKRAYLGADCGVTVLYCVQVAVKRDLPRC